MVDYKNGKIYFNNNIKLQKLSEEQRKLRQDIINSNNYDIDNQFTFPISITVIYILKYE